VPTLTTAPPPRALDERTSELVARSQTGDAEAFEALYRAHVGRVHALCLRMMGDPEHAKELTQDVFVRAWQGLGSFRGEAAFGTWLHRLAINVVRDRQRSEFRRRARFQSGEDLESVGAVAPGVAPDSRIDLERAIATLPPRARNALILHEIHGYKCREVAEMTQTAVGTVQVHLHRARKMLKQVLLR
jgi:RNA polymerase sigma-70 factor, ECF subfamily